VADPEAPDTGSSADARARLRDVVEPFAAGLVRLDPADPSYARRLEEVRALGSRELDATAQTIRRMGRVTGRYEHTVDDERASVARSLRDLRELADEVVHRSDAGTAPRELARRSARIEAQLQAILAALTADRDRLRQYASELDQEERLLAAESSLLGRYVEMADLLDEALAGRIDALAPTQPERADHLRSDALFAVRSRHRDLLTQLAVVTQGQAALSILVRNNRDLLSAMERAISATSTAIRTATLTAQVLETQVVAGERLRDLAAWANVRESVDRIETARARAAEASHSIAKIESVA